LNSLSIVNSEPSVHFCFNLPTAVFDDCVHNFLS
jgi:hypothetical protein